MQEIFHELDPDGDVMLVLHSPQTAFAVWDNDQEYLPPLPLLKRRASPPESIVFVEIGPDYEYQWNQREQTITPPCQESLPSAEEVPIPLDEQDEVRMRVSSSHLALASPYFKRMLRGGWKEGHTLRSDGGVHLDVKEWDHEALLILMNIIHGHTRKVPRLVSLEVLAKIAVLVDYYECVEVVEVFSDMWINQLEKQPPRIYSRDLILWICISWVFRLSKQFTVATRIALKQSRGPIQTLGLPIPGGVVENIDQQRQESVDRIVKTLHHLRTDLRDQDTCSFECSSILLGALTKEMHARSLLLPPPEKPFLGFSFENTAQSVRDIQSPRWSSRGGIYLRKSYTPEHDCSLKPSICPIVDSLEDSMKGLTLEDLSSA